MKQKNDPLYESTKKFEQIMSLVTVMNLSDIPWNEVLTIPARLMWEHNGKCSCGRRVFLFCECKQCLTEAKSNLHFKQVQTLEKLENQDATAEEFMYEYPLNGTLQRGKGKLSDSPQDDDPSSLEPGVTAMQAGTQSTLAELPRIDPRGN